MNSTVEQLAPRLAKRGWALLTFTQKQFMAWTSGEAARLMKHTLPDAARIEGLDVRRPVLLGYSAGGQMAIALWKQRPNAFGGIVLDAAYPLAGTDAEGRPVALTVPEDESIKDVPLLVFVGGKGHAWLVGPPPGVCRRNSPRRAAVHVTIRLRPPTLWNGPPFTGPDPFQG